MIIGGITLPTQYTPLNVTLPRPQLSTAVVGTYGGVAIFDWGAILLGKKINLNWRSMTRTLFNSLDTLYQAGTVIVWASTIDSKSYNVKITAFDGTLLFDDIGNENMLDVSMTMIILSEVAS